jgi:ABC-type nitrate/sulfonate/bicarbonate transport system substrate-binding protein
MDQMNESSATTAVSRRRFVQLMALGATAGLLASVLPTRSTSAVAQAAPAQQDGGPVDLPHAASDTWFGHVPFFVAVEKGFFRDAGLNVTFQKIVASSDRMLALTSGSVQWTNSGSFAAIGEMARGNETFYWLANVDDSPGNQGVVAQPGIGSFEGLRGQKVAYPRNADAEMMLNELLEMNGMSFSDIDAIPIQANEMVAAFVNQNVAAYSVWEPIFSDGIKAVPGAVVLAKDTDTETYKQFGTQMAPDMVILRRELVDNYPETTAKLLTAYFQGVDLVINTPEEAARTVAEAYFKKSFDDTLAGIRSFNYYGAASQAQRTQQMLGTLSAVVEFQSNKNMIQSKPDPALWLRADAVPV